MHKKLFAALIFGALCLGFAPGRARAQTDDERKLEVGAQFSLLRFQERTGVNSTFCTGGVCPTFNETAAGQTEPGGGGRVGYNLNRHVAVEAQLDFFPRNRDLEGGRKLEGLFGVKAGQRYDKVGVFAKARPGFLRSGKGDFHLARPCVAIFPMPVACYDADARTDFAFDVGGVLELYPTARTLIRFDAGDTILRLSDRNVPVVVPPAPGSLAPTRIGVVPVSSETTHNLQVSVGVGFRF